MQLFRFSRRRRLMRRTQRFSPRARYYEEYRYQSAAFLCRSRCLPVSILPLLHAARHRRRRYRCAGYFQYAKI
jgi:hypothetical protein